MSSTFLASVIPSRDHVDGRNSHKKRKHKREVDALSGSESERETDDQSDRQDPSITLGDDGRSPKEVRKSAIVLSYTTPPSSHTSLPSSHVPVVI